MPTSIKAQDLRPGDRCGEWILVDVSRAVTNEEPGTFINATWQRHDHHTHTLEVCRRWYEWDELVDITERRKKQ